MPQLIIGVIGIALVFALFMLLLPAIAGGGIGWGWSKMILSNRESSVSNASNLKKKKEIEISDFRKKIKAGRKQKSEMLTKQRQDIISQAHSLTSDIFTNFISKLDNEYESITSKYYLKEFGDKKINKDMEESIKGKFPNTFSLSKKFREDFEKLLSQVSNVRLDTKNKKDSLLFVDSNINTQKESAMVASNSAKEESDDYSEKYILNKYDESSEQVKNIVQDTKISQDMTNLGEIFLLDSSEVDGIIKQIGFVLLRIKPADALAETIVKSMPQLTKNEKNKLFFELDSYMNSFIAKHELNEYLKE